MNVIHKDFERLVDDVRLYTDGGMPPQLGSWPDFLTDWKIYEVFLFLAFALGNILVGKKGWQEVFAGHYAGTPKGHLHILGWLIATTCLTHNFLGILAGIGATRETAHFLD